jgi:poly(A) polymerase
MELNKFRAGYDFLEMRGEIEEGETQLLAKWWETFQNAGRNMRQAMVADLDGSGDDQPRQRRRKTYRKKKPKASS